MERNQFCLHLRALLVSGQRGGREKDDLFWKVTKSSQTFFFPRATRRLYMNTGWHLIDVYWFLFKPPHKEKLLSVLHCNIVVFLSCRLQEQEQALNLSIKEATAKVSPVSSDLSPSAAAQLPLSLHENTTSSWSSQETGCVPVRSRPSFNAGISIHMRVFCEPNSDLCSVNSSHDVSF